MKKIILPLFWVISFSAIAQDTTPKEKVKAGAIEAKKREADAAILKAKVIAEKKAIAERISQSVLVAVIGTRVFPINYSAGRYSPMLTISYAIQNKSEKAVRQLKGRVVFKDATGDVIGELPVNIDEQIGVGMTIKTSTGRGWRLTNFMDGEAEKIAGREFSSMSALFEPESIAFAGGEILKAPDGD